MARIIKFPYIKIEHQEIAKPVKKTFTERYKDWNRTRFPCQICKHFPDGPDDPLWKQEKCKAGHKMKWSCPSVICIEQCLDDAQLSYGFKPINNSCKDFTEEE